MIRADSVNLSGEEKCVLCDTDKILNREFDFAVMSDSKDYICQACLYRKDKKWKYRVSPHPSNGDVGHMVTDDLDDIHEWLSNDDYSEGEYDIKVDFEYESLELYIDNKLDDKKETK